MSSPAKSIVGRAATVSPPNRFVAIHVEDDYEQLADDDELLVPERRVKTQFFVDDTQSILATNDSPDVPFDFSANPYRGCEHGCAYCFARPSHEYLGFNAGLDFETRIMVKLAAAKLLREALGKPSWKGSLIALSGVTDCYQPAERKFRLTRGLLEVMLEAHQAVTIITKNALVVRDLDLLAPLAAERLTHVNVSITTLDHELARTLEPRTSTPAAKLAAVRKLSATGVPVRVLVAPIIPGLTDHEMPRILEAAAEAGAMSAGYVLLRLPLAVKPIFLDWLATHRPDQRDKVEGLIRDTRDGALYQSEWTVRQRGTGAYAEQIGRSFAIFSRKFGLDRKLPEYDFSKFQTPQAASGQMRLF
ncbi:MAG: PA0069 family radical SAM protein [Planctomycetia bacterium]|nr:PA0069 family radical SAM protein [Planctomycetia bacterium]